MEANILKHIKPSATLILAEQARKMEAEGLDIINLTVGEPDHLTPEHVCTAARKAIDKRKTLYTSYYGIPELRDEICHYIENYYCIDPARENVIVTNGAKQAIYNALRATLNPQDEVIVFTPYWVSYVDMIRLCGGTPVICKCLPNGSIDLERLAFLINSKTKWIIINSPNNPSGLIYNRETMQKLAEILHKHQHVHVLTDDIYHRLSYDEKFISILHVNPALKERTLIINGFSKSCAMTGWRVGYAAGNKQLIKSMGTIQSQSTSCICSIAQHAALAALQEKDLTDKFIAQMSKSIDERRIMIMNFLHNADFKFLKPSGAFYFLISCENFLQKKSLKGLEINNDADFAKVLLQEYLIATVPGSEFGHENHMRISYVVSEENLEKFMERMQKVRKELL